MGHHRLAGLWQSDESEERKNTYFIVNTITNGLNGLSTVPAATVNRLLWRTYYDTDGSTVEPMNFLQMVHETTRSRQSRWTPTAIFPTYFQMGAFVTYGHQVRQNTSLDLQLNVDNLLDAHELRPAAADIDTAGYFGPAGQVAVYRWDMQRPRTYRLTATVRF